MTDTARVLLTAVVLAGSSITMFAWHITRIDPELPGRLIGELRLAQWAALLLSAGGAASIGLAVASPAVPGAHLEAWFGLAFVVAAGFILQRDPREALSLVAVAFLMHALFNLTHRPGWLPVELVPRWYVVACAIFDVYMAALSYWAQRR